MALSGIACSCRGGHGGEARACGSRGLAHGGRDLVYDKDLVCDGMGLVCDMDLVYDDKDLVYDEKDLVYGTVLVYGKVLAHYGMDQACDMVLVHDRNLVCDDKGLVCGRFPLAPRGDGSGGACEPAEEEEEGGTAWAWGGKSTGNCAEGPGSWVPWREPQQVAGARV